MGLIIKGPHFKGFFHHFPYDNWDDPSKWRKRNQPTASQPRFRASAALLAKDLDLKFFTSCSECGSGIHSSELTWNLKITPLNRKIISQTFIFSFHVSFRGCMFFFCFGQVPPPRNTYHIPPKGNLGKSHRLKSA